MAMRCLARAKMAQQKDFVPLEFDVEKIDAPYGMTGLEVIDEDDTPFDEQIDILECAGRWYVFWGQRGYPIWGYF